MSHTHQIHSRGILSIFLIKSSFVHNILNLLLLYDFSLNIYIIPLIHSLVVDVVVVVFVHRTRILLCYCSNVIIEYFIFFYSQLAIICFKCDEIWDTWGLCEAAHITNSKKNCIFQSSSLSFCWLTYYGHVEFFCSLLSSCFFSFSPDWNFVSWNGWTIIIICYFLLSTRIFFVCFQCWTMIFLYF